MIGSVGNPCSIPKGGFVVGREMCSDGLGQVMDSSGPKRHTIYSTGLYPPPQRHTATSSNPMQPHLEVHDCPWLVVWLNPLLGNTSQ